MGFNGEAWMCSSFLSLFTSTALQVMFPCSSSLCRACVYMQRLLGGNKTAYVKKEMKNIPRHSLDASVRTFYLAKCVFAGEMRYFFFLPNRAVVELTLARIGCKRRNNNNSCFSAV